jgi:ornithine cyclodeaminase
VLVLTGAEVAALLDRRQLIEAVAQALADLSAGDAVAPARTGVAVPDADGLLAVMPGRLSGGRALGAKLVSVFPGNAGGGHPTHQAVVVLFDPTTGSPEALIDGTRITAERTAAASAVATRLLARNGAAVLAVLGTGVQALAHLRTVPLVCGSLDQILVAGRSFERAAALADSLSASLVPVRAVVSVDEAVAAADIVCATTHAADPIVCRRRLRPGTHVNSVGLHPTGTEVDTATVVDARVFVEWRAAALAPYPAGARDLVAPMDDGLITPSEIAEIGEVILGRREGRTSGDELTLYKSVGVAVEDLAAAALVVEEAHRRGVGSVVDL